jgi:hypothetical protein
MDKNTDKVFKHGIMIQNFLLQVNNFFIYRKELLKKGLKKVKVDYRLEQTIQKGKMVK